MNIGNSHPAVSGAVGLGSGDLRGRRSALFSPQLACVAVAAQYARSRIGAERDELATSAPTPAPPVEPASQNSFAALRGLSRSHHRQVTLGRSGEQRREPSYAALDPLGGGLGAETDAHRVGRLTGDGEGGGGDDPDPASPRRRGKIVGAPRLRERQPEMGGGRIAGDLDAGEDFARLCDCAAASRCASPRRAAPPCRRRPSARRCAPSTAAPNRWWRAPRRQSARSSPWGHAHSRRATPASGSSRSR